MNIFKLSTTEDKMIKKSILSLVAVFYFCLPSHATSILDSMAHPDGVRMTTEINEICYVPYNIETAGYNTGLHIAIDSREPVTLWVGFFCGADVYAFQAITVGPEGWTGFARDLLPAGAGPLRNPSTIAIATLGNGIGRFWVTQFLFTQAGFSHVVLTSEPL